MKARITKFIIGLTLGLMLALLVAFNTLLVWVATGPRSLQQLTPYIERALVGESDIHAKIGETWLIWDGWKKPLDLRLKNVQLLTKEGQLFSSFPEISLGLDILMLPFGKILPTSLAVKEPIISLKQNADKTIGFGSDNTEQAQHLDSNSDTLAALMESLINPKSGSSLRKLQSIELLDADITIGNETEGVILKAPDSNLIIRKNSDDEFSAIINTVLEYGDVETGIDGTVSYNKARHRIEGRVNVSKLHVATLSTLLFNQPELAALNFPVSGAVGFAISKEGQLEALRFNVDGGRGKIVHERLDGPLAINRLKLVGRANNQLRDITLEQAQINFSGSEFTGTLHAIRTKQGLGITGDMSITDVPAEQVKKFWPLGVSPLSRDWVINNIRDGGITKATAKLNIQPGDLDKKLLPKEAVAAQVELKDAKVKYLDGHPEVRGVNGLVKVDGLSLEALLSHGQAFTGTTLSSGRVYIADLNPDNPLIEISLHADAPATDVVTLLGLPMLEHAKHLNLDAKKAAGKVSGDANLGFYFFDKNENGDEMPMTYHVKAKLENVSSPAFLERFNISNATGDIVVDDKAIEYTGNAIVNGSTITGGTIRYAYEQEEGLDTFIKGTATVNDDILKNFGVTLPVLVKETLTAAMDAKLSTQKDTTSVESFSVKGEGVSLTGRAVLTPDGRDVSHLTVQNLKYAKNNLDLIEYGAIEGGMKLKLKGASFDAQHFLEEDGDGFSFEHFPAFDAEFDVGTVYTVGGNIVEDLKGTMLCTITRCTQASIKALVAKKAFVFSIIPEGKNRRLNISAEDAGGLLRSLGLIDTMQGGNLGITGQFQDQAGDSSLKGSLRIDDYTMVNAPVLAKLVSLASLTGIFDTLAGKGISFSKLRAPFALHDDVITIKDAKTHGAAMGLTAEGTITFPKSALDLEGTIVPSYTLNNVVGNVPVIGDILTDGGEGIFAARYSMEGDSNNPEVMVNPLSILTPGFLRNLFDVF